MLTVISGPTRAHKSEYYPDTIVPSFEESYNARIEELEAQGATNITTTFSHTDNGVHYAYVQFTPAHAHVQKDTFSMQEVADRLGVSRTTISERIRRGEIAHIPVAGRKLIPASEYMRILQSAR